MPAADLGDLDVSQLKWSGEQRHAREGKSSTDDLTSVRFDDTLP
jgi:hypothetical protein